MFLFGRSFDVNLCTVAFVVYLKDDSVKVHVCLLIKKYTPQSADAAACCRYLRTVVPNLFIATDCSTFDNSTTEQGGGAQIVYSAK